MFFLFLFSEPLQLLTDTVDVYLRLHPPAVAKAASSRLAEKYVSYLSQVSVGMMPTFHAGGILAWHKGYAVFLADCSQFNETAAEKLIGLYTKHATQNPRPITTAPEGRVTSKAEIRYTNARKTLSWPSGCQSITENIHIGNQAVPIVSESCMAQLVKQTMNLPGHIGCERRLNIIGDESSETVATYTITQNGKPSFFVKQYHLSKAWGARKFDFFKKAFALDLKPISTEFGWTVTFCLPVGLWNVGDIYIEVLPLVPGRSVAEIENRVVDSKLKRQIWAILGKTLGAIHKKIGQFNTRTNSYVIPQLDYQRKNVFYDDDTMTVSIIDLDCLGKDSVRDLRLIIPNEILMITKNIELGRDGVLEEKGEISLELQRLYINGYLSAFEGDSVLHNKLLVEIAMVRQEIARKKEEEELEKDRQAVRNGTATPAALRRVEAADFVAAQVASLKTVQQSGDEDRPEITEDDRRYMAKRKQMSGVDVNGRDLMVGLRLLAQEKSELIPKMTQDNPDLDAIRQAKIFLAGYFGEGRGQQILREGLMID